MQRCPKCGRTYQDDSQKFCTFDGGRLGGASDSESAPTVLDLNTTMQSNYPVTPPPGSTAPIQPPDLNRTVAGGPSTPTSQFERHTTGPTQGPTSSPLQPPQQEAPTPPPPPHATAGAPPQQAPTSSPLPPPTQQHVSLPPSSQAAPEAKKTSKLPWILGGIAVLLLLALGASGVLLWVMLNKSAKPSGGGTTINTSRDDKANANTGANANGNDNTTTANTSPSPAGPPPNAAQFVNSRRNLNNLLSEHYADFSFYYPRSWELDTKAGGEGSSNFVRVERKLPPDFTQEDFAVGYYESNGTVESDRPIFPSLVRSFDSKSRARFPEYQKISEGETVVNSIKGYEFRFQSISRGTEKGDITIWGRVVFLPPGTEGDKRGVTLLMLATSVAPELTSIDDVGVRGELPLILKTFKLGQ
jgi:hypothetical protein